MDSSALIGKLEAAGLGEPGDTEAGYHALASWFRGRGPVVVAYSGGVDSTLVLQAACDGIGSAQVTAVTAKSASLSRRELLASKELAERIGVRQLILETEELSDLNYRANRGNRCFFCKSALYAKLMERLAGSSSLPPLTVLVDGTNADDLSDTRPGHAAARAAGVLHPLVELGIGKAQVRALSRHRGLPTWNKPEMACLASRIPAGTEVTEDKLAMIESAEDALFRLGLRSFRVRYHELHSLRDAQNGQKPLTLARIECSTEELIPLLSGEKTAQITQAVQAQGFAFVTLDLQGYRKGGVPHGLT